MSNHVAVTSDCRALRRLLLLFDRVGITGLDTLLELSRDGLESMNIRPYKALYDELSTLLTAGIIFQPKAEDAEYPQNLFGEISIPTDRPENADSEALAQQLASRHAEYVGLMLQQFAITEPGSAIRKRLDEHHKWQKRMEIRLIAARMRARGDEAYPIDSLTATRGSIKTMSQHAVVEVVLSGIPMVRDDVPLEKLLEFRTDEKSRHMLLGLRRWSRQISDATLSPAALAEEMEWQISEYQEHMRQHKLRAANAKLKILLKLPLEVLENTARLKLSKSIDALFEIREVRASLLAEELKAPGRELAYMIKVRESFGR